MSLRSRYREYKQYKQWHHRYVYHWETHVLRQQTNRILKNYPEPEPMPTVEWLCEISSHYKLKYVAKWMRFRGTLRAVRYALEQ